MKHILQNYPPVRPCAIHFLRCMPRCISAIFSLEAFHKEAHWAGYLNNPPSEDIQYLYQYDTCINETVVPSSFEKIKKNNKILTTEGLTKMQTYGQTELIILAHYTDRSAVSKF